VAVIDSALRPTAVPAELLRAVVAYFRPRQVILFGSHARGDAGGDSDIDLAVVLDDSALRAAVAAVEPGRSEDDTAPSG
jgi:predicted nucleotidyltransferase